MTSRESFNESENPENRVISRAQRKIRHVPLGYNHPRSLNGEFVGLYEEQIYYPEEIEEMIEDGFIQHPDDVHALHMPDFSEYPPEAMGICIYETCSEGTPVSPIFPDTTEGRMELLRYAAEHVTIILDQMTDFEGWAAILFSGKDVAAIIDNDTGDLSAIDLREL